MMVLTPLVPPFVIQEYDLPVARPKLAYWAVGIRYCAGVSVYEVEPNLMTKLEVGALVKEARPERLSVVPPAAERKAL